MPSCSLTTTSAGHLRRLLTTLRRRTGCRNSVQCWERRFSIMSSSAGITGFFPSRKMTSFRLARQSMRNVRKISSFLFLRSRRRNPLSKSWQKERSHLRKRIWTKQNNRELRPADKCTGIIRLWLISIGSDKVFHVSSRCWTQLVEQVRMKFRNE